MPLILICGNPCTGKTSVANKLLDYFQSKGISNIELINEEYLKITKKDGYGSSFNEKSTRGALKSAVDHKLNSECYVIVDSLNYIKGFRYELYCSARTFRTPSCVVWVECNETVADDWNTARLELTGDAFDKEIMSDLRRRFEAPNENNRWDSPLFRIDPTAAAACATVVQSSDMKREDSEIQVQSAAVCSSESVSAVNIVVATGVNESSKEVTQQKSAWKPRKATNNSAGSVFTMTSTTAASSATASNSSSGAVYFSGTAARRQQDLLKDFSSVDETLPRIYAYLVEAVAPTPNSSTLTTQHGEADLLYELDRTSQRIMQTVVLHQSENVEGTPIKFVEYDRELTLHRHAGLAELQRYRRQFVKINGQHPPSSSTAVGTSFIDFLALQL